MAGHDRAAPTLVEFYTAQGCPACLPVLGLVSELAKRRDVLVLSLHVDYWDYMGWKDHFALPINVQRQRSYASQLGRPYVYTPQLIVHGATEVPASDPDAVLAAVTNIQKVQVAAVSIENRGAQGMIVRIGDGVFDGQATVWLALFDSRRETRVQRGVNADKTIVNTNIVRMLTPIGSWTGKAVEIPLSTGGMTADKPDSCAVFVQAERLGPILGVAAMLPHPDAEQPAR